MGKSKRRGRRCKLAVSNCEILSDETVEAIKAKLGAEQNDLILFGAGDYDSTKASLSALRLYLGKRLELFDKNQFNFLWVVDFPDGKR